MSADAPEFAREKHKGQEDKLKRDYFDAHLTPIAEAAAVFGPDAEAAGWLHDVIEDTRKASVPVTPESLLESGFAPLVVTAVESVSKQAGEPYNDLITRSCADPLGRLVKLVDNAWNITCNPSLARNEPDEAARLLRDKYFPARERLLASVGLSQDSPEMRAVQAVLDRHLARLEGAPISGTHLDL
ncbi:hypothetical protein [Nocardioides sp. Root140]|uniref:hypothetical protein n=1 Tax=Nocardioides sp. Root140 TaxID=1736460 RepID=UPI000700857F|nr:hypothetical protein [Nocardioides sp. Root140]KQY51553.1 hypothetical protein ASD30_19465 [Nocardioides sp. Root140]